MIGYNLYWEIFDRLTSRIERKYVYNPDGPDEIHQIMDDSNQKECAKEITAFIRTHFKESV